MADCLRVVAAGDTIVLLGDGVYASIGGSAACDALLACGAKLCVLQPDAHAAGVTAHASFKDVDMDAFVALSEQYPRQQAWY